jgi:hypothetical protein
MNKKLQVPVWPEAADKERQYANTAAALSGHRKTIDDQLKIATVKKTTGALATVSGPYYQTYLDKKGNWIDRQDEIIKLFRSFLADIDICIANATAKAQLWRTRIGVMKEV